MNIKFTVAIPLYNKEEYVVRCLESIKDQAYDDYNIFIVNDGSTDTSLNVVKNWLKDNVDIKVLADIIFYFCCEIMKRIE